MTRLKAIDAGRKMPLGKARQGSQFDSLTAVGAARSIQAMLQRHPL